jgi:RecJ-like exonuclease
MWEKCPVCEGKGAVTQDYSEDNCKTCSGKGIISSLTGLPPNGLKIHEAPRHKADDFLSTYKKETRWQ